MKFIGVDPGSSGGIVALTDWIDGYEKPTVDYCALDFDKVTEADIASFVDNQGKLYAKCVIEKVGPNRNRSKGEVAQGASSMFTFGRSYGFLRGLLIAYSVTFVEISPQRWQKAMGIGHVKDETTTEKKNRHKALAQQLFPHEKLTHWKADALLLATYCRRHHAELF